MTWQLALELALRYGLPWVDSLLKIIEQHGEPTPEAWAKVMTLAAKPYDDYIEEAKARALLETIKGGTIASATASSPAPPG